MNKMIVQDFKTIDTLKMLSMRHIMIVIILITTLGCNKNSKNSKGTKKTIEGTVFEDCNANVSKGKKIYLQYVYSGCFGGGILSQDSTLTDNNGHFKFQYIERVNDNSTTSYYYYLTIPNSSISISNPSGNWNLYPNDTIMNAVIRLKFPNTYTSTDTFFYQFNPSPNGFIEEAKEIKFFVGPFKDTTLILNNWKVGNINSIDNGKSHCGAFRWSIRRLNGYYSVYNGDFYLTHVPCNVADSFEYSVVPQPIQ